MATAITAPVPTFTGGLVDPGARDPRSLVHVDGFSRLRAEQSAKRRLQLAEAAKMWQNFLNQRIDPYLMMEAVRGPKDWTYPELHRMAPSIFNEAMTTSDFTNLTSYVLDRTVLANWATYPKTYPEIAKVNSNVKDFRTIDRWVMDGGEQPFQRVGETAAFNRESVKSGKYSYQVYKYEKGMQLSWELVINDDMDMFTQLPQRLVTGGVRTIEQFWLQMIAGSTGPKSSFYGSAISLPTGGTVNNVLNLSAYTTGSFTGTANPVMSILNLILGAGLFMNQQTAEGRPIDVSSDELIVLVGDGVLYQTLQHIINTDQIATTVLGGTKASGSVTSDLMGTAKNWIRGRLRPVYAPELKNIVTTNLATSYWLFAKPSSGRPSMELGFLQGYEAPALYRKASNTQRIGGGGTVEEMGDFETMSTEFKGLIVFGGTVMDPRATMASNGTGS